MTSHPSGKALESLLEAELDRSLESRLISHVAECERCFAAVEELWFRVSSNRPDLTLLGLEAVTSERIESRLFSQIHAASVATAASRLATIGFLEVTLGLLRPLLDRPREASGHSDGDER